jgi:hypothetical protein
MASVMLEVILQYAEQPPSNRRIGADPQQRARVAVLLGAVEMAHAHSGVGALNSV